MNLSEATDDQLLEDLVICVRRERGASADVLERLSLVMTRNVAVRKGYPSAFDLCVGRLGYSEAAAYKRIQAAKAVRVHPELLEDLREGRFTLSAIVALAPHLTSPEGSELLRQARGKTSRELERMLAGISPRAEVVDRIRTIQILPDGAERVQFTFTGDGELRQRIDRARELLRHKHPAGRLENVLFAALEAFLEKNDPVRKLARKEESASRQQKDAPRETPAEIPIAQAEDRSRHIPENVRQEVWRRDDGRCTFRSEDGRRCGSTDWIEFDHIQPWALGGPSDTAKNIRLMCRAHNQFLADIAFGEGATGRLDLPPSIPP